MKISFRWRRYRCGISDPFDRGIIAQSIARNLVIVTPDDAVRAYPEVRSLW